MSEPQPHEIIWTLTNAEIASRCLHVVAELGVADAVGDESVTAAALASTCGAMPMRCIGFFVWWLITACSDAKEMGSAIRRRRNCCALGIRCPCAPFHG